MGELLDMGRQGLALPWVQALAIILASIIVAKVTDFVITRGLARLVRRTSTTVDDQVIKLLHGPIFLTVVFVGLHAATRLLELGPPFQGLILGTILTVAIIIWVRTTIRVGSMVLEALGRSRVSWVDVRTLPLLDNVIKIMVIGIAVYALLVAWNLDVTPWLASAGILGLAFGFAAKDSLANLFGGIFIVADAPYKLGDFIVLDSGERGRVTKIGLRSTRLLTRDDVEITIPNAQIANAKITNESGGPWEKHRATVRVGVAYGSDVDQVRRVLLEAAGSVSGICEEPEPRVRFTEFGDSALLFRLLCWVEKPESRGLLLDALNTAVYKKFASEGIQIPFPQRDLHVKQFPEGRFPGSS